MRDRFVQAPLLVRSYKCIWHFELGNQPETSTKKKKTGNHQKVIRISHMGRFDLYESLRPSRRMAVLQEKRALAILSCG